MDRGDEGSLIKQRRSFLRGPQTSTYTDMFGMDWPMYENSTIYFVTNVGQKRQKVLEYLNSKSIEVLEENSIFGYIEISIPHYQAARVIELELDALFDCKLLWEGAC